MRRRKEKTLEQLQSEYFEDCGQPPPPLTPQQMTFVQHLLSGKNISVAALATPVSRRTAVRWMQPSHPVADEYERQRVALHDVFVSRIAQMHDLGLSTLEALLKDRESGVRLAALKFLHEMARRPEPRTLVSLQDEEVDERKSNLFSRVNLDREVWLSDNPLEFFRDSAAADEQEEGAL